MNFDDNWTSCIDLVGSDHPQGHTKRVACWRRKRMVNGVCASITSVEYANCLRSVSFTIDPVHLEYTGGFRRIFEDRVSGFYQIRVHDEDIEKTAFNTRFGGFEWVVMPFGLCNAPSTFLRVVNDVLRDQLGIFVWVYIKDILVFSKDADEHE